MLPRQEERPSYVTFMKHPVEDREQTLAQGRYMTKDVDFAVITPVGSKDRIPREVSAWLEELEQNVREDRIPPAWAEQYRQAYERWKKNEEIPLFGTPIKGWPVISPSQQKNIIAANVLTVEDLAQANGEALHRIGMGALELKEKAEKWLITAQNVGQVAGQNEQLRMENKILKEQIEVMARQIQQLEAKVGAE